MTRTTLLLSTLAAAVASFTVLGIAATLPAETMEHASAEDLAVIEGVLDPECVTPWQPRSLGVSLALAIPGTDYVGPALFDNQVFQPSIRPHTHEVTRADPDFEELEQAIRLGAPAGLQLVVLASVDTAATCTGAMAPAVLQSPMEPWYWADGMRLTVEPFVFREDGPDHYSLAPHGLRYRIVVFHAGASNDGVVQRQVKQTRPLQLAEVLAGSSWHPR